MILHLIIISAASGLAAAYAARPVGLILPFGLAGIIWISGVLVINRGIGQMSAPVDAPQGLISLGILLILTGLAMATSLAVGRLLRGKARVWVAGLIGAALTLASLAIFYITAFGI